MLALEVIVRGSSNFIGFPDICSKALLDAGFVVMLFLVLHLLGGLLEIGSRSVHFAASLFYYRISRGPKGSNTSTSLISSNSVHRLGETKLVGPTIERRFLAETPEWLIGDCAYDSDPLDVRMRERFGVQL